MTEKEPKQKQIREFWEWCGLKWFWNHNPDCACGAKDDDDSMRSWYYKDGGNWQLATRFWHEDIKVDLNNLFKYAVPQFAIKFGCIKLRELLCKWINDTYMSIPKAEDLILAIWEVIKK